MLFRSEGRKVLKMKPGQQQIEDEAVRERQNPADKKVAGLQRWEEREKKIGTLGGQDQRIALQPDADDVRIGPEGPLDGRRVKGDGPDT